MFAGLALMCAIHCLHVLLEVSHELLHLFGIVTSFYIKLLLQVFLHSIEVSLVRVVHFAVLLTP